MQDAVLGLLGFMCIFVIDNILYTLISLFMYNVVILDINETLMHNEYLVGGGYSQPVARPHLKSFITELKTMGVHLGLWSGAFSAKRLKTLTDFILPASGLKKNDLVLNFPVLPSCTTRKSYGHNKGKKIVLKPVSLVRQIFMGAYQDIILFDNDIEKSLGFSQKPGSRWSNEPGEHIEVIPFHSKNVLTDNELNVRDGVGANKLFTRIRELQNRSKSIRI